MNPNRTPSARTLHNRGPASTPSPLSSVFLPVDNSLGVGLKHPRVRLSGALRSQNSFGHPHKRVDFRLFAQSTRMYALRVFLGSTLLKVPGIYMEPPQTVS